MGVRGRSHDLPNKSNMADGVHIEFRKNAIISVRDEDIGTQFRRKIQHGADYRQLQNGFLCTM